MPRAPAANPCRLGSARAGAPCAFPAAPLAARPGPPSERGHRASRYAPELNATYADVARHDSCAVLPARPYKPKDRAKTEVDVRVVERWILARLRHHTFHSLSARNDGIRELLVELNARPFQPGLHAGQPSLPRLLEQLSVAHADDSCPRLMRQLAHQAADPRRLGHRPADPRSAATSWG